MDCFDYIKHLRCKMERVLIMRPRIISQPLLIAVLLALDIRTVHSIWRRVLLICFTHYLRSKKRKPYVDYHVHAFGCFYLEPILATKPSVRIFVKFDIGVVYIQLSSKCEFRDNQLSSNHTSLMGATKFPYIFSILLGRFV